MRHVINGFVSGDDMSKNHFARVQNGAIRFLRLKRLGQAQGKRQNCRNPRAPQTPGHQKRGQHIRRQQHQRGGEEPTGKIFDRGHAQPLNRRTNGPVRGRQGALGVQNISCQKAGFIAIKTGPQIGAKWLTRQRFTHDAGQCLTVRQATIAIKHPNRLPDRPGHAGFILRVGRAEDSQPIQHRHEQPRQRQTGPFGIRGNMEQNNLPLPQFFARHQGRAVAQLGHHAFGKGRVRLRHDLRAHTHLVRHRKAKERASFGKGGKCFGFTPAHRAANATTPCPQPHRHERVFFRTRHAGRGHAWPGKANEQATSFGPFDQRGLFSRRQNSHIRQDHNVRVGGQHV